MEKPVTYFTQVGKQNTDQVLELAAAAARSRQIRHLILASTRGYTAERALEVCPDLDVVAVGIERSSFDAALLERMTDKGWPVIFSRELDYNYPREMQTAFRRFGQGTKVAVEVAVAAVMAGLVNEGEQVVGVGGSSAGADTALVLTASYGFADVRVGELLCKPLL